MLSLDRISLSSNFFNPCSLVKLKSIHVTKRTQDSRLNQGRDKPSYLQKRGLHSAVESPPLSLLLGSPNHIDHHQLMSLSPTDTASARSTKTITETIGTIPDVSPQNLFLNCPNLSTIVSFLFPPLPHVPQSSPYRFAYDLLNIRLLCKRALLDPAVMTIALKDFWLRLLYYLCCRQNVIEKQFDYRPLYRDWYGNITFAKAEEKPVDSDDEDTDSWKSWEKSSVFPLYFFKIASQTPLQNYPNAFLRLARFFKNLPHSVRLREELKALPQQLSGYGSDDSDDSDDSDGGDALSDIDHDAIITAPVFNKDGGEQNCPACGSKIRLMQVNMGASKTVNVALRHCAFLLSFSCEQCSPLQISFSTIFDEKKLILSRQHCETLCCSNWREPVCASECIICRRSMCWQCCANPSDGLVKPTRPLSCKSCAFCCWLLRNDGELKNHDTLSLRNYFKGHWENGDGNEIVEMRSLENAVYPGYGFMCSAGTVNFGYRFRNRLDKEDTITNVNLLDPKITNYSKWELRINDGDFLNDWTRLDEIVEIAQRHLRREFERLNCSGSHTMYDFNMNKKRPRIR